MKEANQNTVSLNKYISSTGICSRREADRLIESGRVTINGKVAQKGNRVMHNDEVLIDQKPLKKKPKTIYIALNKPPGIVCTTDPKEPQNIVDFVNHKERLFPIGRLDKPSQGLILLTNDGDMVNHVLRVENNHEKEYIVRIDRPISNKVLKQMEQGVPILGTVTKKCKTRKINTHTFSIVLTQGLNRQIRRMCEYFNYKVSYLKRIRIMHIHLENLPKGQWRPLTEEEVSKLK